VFGEAIIPSQVWSTGWQFLGAGVTFKFFGDEPAPAKKLITK